MNWINKLLAEWAPASSLLRKGEKRIFLDYASATPLLDEVGKAMEKYWAQDFYNPSAIYAEALSVKKDMEDYRTRVARVLGAGQKEIIFTAGGTESANLAILGAFEEAKKIIEKPHIIVSAIEHPAVMSAAQEAERRGGELSIVEVDEEGIVSQEKIKELIKKNTVLVSIGLANSEIGTVQPIARIGRIVKEARKKYGGAYPLFHTDASPAASYFPIGLESLQCDLVTLDGAKIYGPKGSGVLAMRRGVELHPIIFGGGQERGLRSGTSNPALAAGFTRALEISQKDREAEGARLHSLRQMFIATVMKDLPTAILNGSGENHLPNTVSISIPGILAEFLLLKLDTLGVAVSVGSACSSDEKVSGSPIIRALGKPELSESTIRFSFGRFTTEKDLNEAIKIFCRTVQNMLK